MYCTAHAGPDVYQLQIHNLWMYISYMYEPSLLITGYQALAQGIYLKSQFW